MRISKEGPSEPKSVSSSDSSSSTSDNYSRSVRTKKGRKGTRSISKTAQSHKNTTNSFDGGVSRGHRSQSSTTAGRGEGHVDAEDYEMDSNSGNPSGVPISSISSGIGNDNPSFFTDEVFFSQNDVVVGEEPPPPPPQRKKGGRRKKKFPPSPLPLYSSPRKTSLSSRSPSSYNNETDLVDYEDFGPSSSTYDDEESSESESELALRATNLSSSLFHGNSSRESARGGRTAGMKDEDSPYSRRASLYENKDEPCSSSSVRERLAHNSYNNPPTNSNSSLVEDPFSSVFVGERGGGTSSERGGGSEAPTTSTTTTRSSMKKLPADKYKFSGVGHHFGRKKTLSSMDLLEDGGGGGEGGEGDGSESSNKTGFLAGVDVLGWATRLKAFSIILLASTFILSTSSLLFVFPIIVDPILLGLEAHFSNSSVLCRTTNIRKGSGSSECSMQSCREGCTADSFQCTFIDVEYFPSLQLPSSSSTDINITSSFIEQSLASFNTSSTSDVDSEGNSASASSESRRENGTLFININGCGYPPSVNCSEFHEKYGKIGTPFLCHFSQSNASIVVPNYNVSQQKRYLFLAFVIPIGLSVGSALSLFFILKVRWACRRGNKGSSREIDKTPTKLFETAEGLEDKLRGKDSPGESKKTKKKKKEPLGGSHAKANGISNSSTGQNHLKNHSEMNGTVIGDVKRGNKANGFALQNTISGLMGMSSPHKIHDSIKTLPHQHDSFEGNSVSILNGFAAFAIDQPETNHYNRSAVKRKPLYAKNNPNRNKLFHANSIDETRRLPSEGLMSHQTSNGIHSMNSNPPNGNANNESGHRNKKSKKMAEDKL